MELVLKIVWIYSLLAVGVYGFYKLAFTSLKSGVAKSRWGDFDRLTDPFSFWVVVVFGVMAGLLGCGLAIFLLLHPLPPLKL